MDLRQKLGLLVLEHEPETDGLIRITQDQAQRTAQRLEGQIKTAKERAPKKPRVKKEPKMKIPKPHLPLEDEWLEWGNGLPTICKRCDAVYGTPQWAQACPGKKPRKPRIKKVKHEMESTPIKTT